MTPNEFKAWFDGFTEAFEGRIPTKAQWGRIKDRVAEIDGKRITETVYVDRYVRPYPYYYGGLQPSWQYLGNATCGSVSSNTVGVGQNTQSMQQYSQTAACNNLSNQIGSVGTAFNSLQAMADLGRAEAAEIA